jgi:tryptophan halogenase
VLRTVAMERGVERIVDHVTEVTQHENGDIAALKTRDGRTVEADFFIDCTGFAALLIEKTLKEPFVDFTDRLLCDRAVACQIPLTGEPPRPYTTCTAKSSGWMWEIDLTSRRGTGYVYSSQYISDEDAEAELLAHINPDGKYQNLQTRKLMMRIGRRRNAWVGNCCAIGLSAGFLEPLESTGIHLIELGVQMLVDYLGEGEARGPLQDYYNRMMSDIYEEIADFIQLHYIFNKRYGEPFWDAYRNPVLSDTLKEQMQVWKHRMPSRNDFRARVNVFDGYNICAVMGGLNALPEHATMAPYIDLEHSQQLLANIARLREEAVRVYPSHADILKKYRIPEMA